MCALQDHEAVLCDVQDGMVKGHKRDNRIPLVSSASCGTISTPGILNLGVLSLGGRQDLCETVKVCMRIWQ